MIFENVLAGQRFIYDDKEYLKIPEIKQSCCQIKANAIRLKDNKQILFEYKAEIEVIADDL